MARLDLPVPFKFAVVGLASSDSPDKRAMILKAVEEALRELPGVEVSGTFFQFHNVEIKVVTDGQ